MKVNEDAERLGLGPFAGYPVPQADIRDSGYRRRIGELHVALGEAVEALERAPHLRISERLRIIDRLKATLES